MTVTGSLYKAARASAWARAASRGPKPLAKRAARVAWWRIVARAFGPRF